MECRILFRRVSPISVSRFVVAMLFASLSARAQDPPLSFEDLLQRIERLEQDNQQLRHKVNGLEEAASLADNPGIVARDSVPSVSSSGTKPGWNDESTDPGVLFAGGEIDRQLTQSDVRSIVAEETARPESSGDSGPSDFARDQRIADLDSAFRSFQDKASRKTYPTVTVNGVFQADAGWIHQDAASETQFGQIQDGADFRRARLSAKGSVTELTNYFFQMDFGFFGRPTFTDLWVEQTKVPFFGNVRIGQWKQPFSLEVVSSFRYTTFMERSVLFQPFTAFRHIGIGFYDYSDDQSRTWAASVFRSGQDQFGGSLSTDGGWGTAERLTWLPAWECSGANYLHLGVGHFFNSPPDDSINFRTIPEFFIGANGPGAVGTSGQAVPGGSNGTPFFISTGNLNVSSYNVLGSELLWVQGIFSLQSEAMVALVNQNAGSVAALPGAYVQAGYFLTGENRPYDRKSGAIDRVIPKSNLNFAGKNCNAGWGAWEIAARYSYLDLNDSTIRGGTISDFTAGVNWYWNPFTKMVFNYVHSVPDSPVFPKSATNMFGLRAQIDF